MAGCCLFHASTIDRLQLRKLDLPLVYENKWLKSELGTVRYIVSGQLQRPSVMLMPDPPNSIEQMASLIEMLSTDFRVIAFEAPGFGYSRASAKFNFSISHNAQIIIEILQALCAEGAILAMTCIGALPAVYAAKLRPDLVAGLVLGQTPSIEEAKHWANRVDVSGLLGTPYIGQAVLKIVRGKISKNWYESAFPKNYDSMAHCRETIDNYKRGASFSLASAFQALKVEETNTSDLIVKTNAVVLWGMQDRTHRKTNRHGIMDCLPNGRFVELKNSGHFPDVEAPEIFSNAVRSLVAQG